MEAEKDATFDGSEHAWVEEFHELSTKAGEQEIYVRVWWPGADLNAIGFQPQVHERAIHVLLQRQAPSGLANGVLSLSLPSEELVVYERYVSETGEICLALHWLICGVGRGEEMNFWISTNLDFLILVIGEARKA